MILSFFYINTINLPLTRQILMNFSFNLLSFKTKNLERTKKKKKE